MEIKKILECFLADIEKIDQKKIAAYELLSIGRLPPFRPHNNISMNVLISNASDIIKNLSIVTDDTVFKKGRKENVAVNRLIRQLVSFVEKLLGTGFVWTLDFVDRGAAFQHSHASLIYEIARALDPDITTSATKSALQRVRAARSSKKTPALRA